MITFAERLLYLRNKCGYTQKQLAKRCGLSQSTIASYESGNRIYTRNLLCLAKVLGVSALWLEKGTGAMAPVVLETANNYNTHWPFQKITQAQYQALNDQQQQTVENVLQALVDSFTEEHINKALRDDS